MWCQEKKGRALDSCFGLISPHQQSILHPYLQAPRVYKGQQWRCNCGYEMSFTCTIVVRITAAVYEVMEPLLNNMREEIIRSVEREIGNLSQIVSHLAAELKDHKNETATELADLRYSLQSVIDNLPWLTACGGTGGWRRAVHLDMRDPSTNCPSGWNMTEYSKRTCGRKSTERSSCDSVFFPVAGGAYSQVCSRIRAYQRGLPDAFYGYNHGRQTTIDSVYFSGVAVMHGSPRQHIWTFANGASENFSLSSNCPCDTAVVTTPPFVGEDYFCESGYVWPGYYNSTLSYRFHSDDTLWDGEDCHSTSSCCSLHNPPYFTKTLSQTTTDDLELRMCLLNYYRLDNVAVELVELYVK